MGDMKPTKAWAVADGRGVVQEHTACPKKACAAAFVTEDGERVVRVRILDDAAVKRAIAALQAFLKNLRTGALNTAGTPSYKQYADKINAVKSAIRDLGGKP